MYQKILKFISMAVAALALGDAGAADGKVLYVTQIPGPYHDYQAQWDIFKDKIADGQDWEITLFSGANDELITKLRDPEFAKGYDLIVYNMCVAETRDVESCANVIKQTREDGIPAVLIHCAMHSWWDTFKRGEKIEGHDTAMAVPARVEAWRAAHGDKPFPVYGDFTGIASTQHGPQAPIALTKVAAQADHPATARLPEGYSTTNAELYNNFYIVDGVVPLLEGTQRGVKSIVMWTCPQGESQVMGLTIGHGMGEWNEVVFQNLVTDGINYMLENPKP